MDDISGASPDHSRLFGVASTQHGYFTAAQARACGFDWSLLTRHVQGGRFIRVRRGLYRLRDYPSSPREEVVVAWLALGKDRAVVSHDTALDLLGLSDVIPAAVHLTLPRAKRHPPELLGVRVHTTTRSLRSTDVTVRDGIRITSAGRTILDSAAAGTAPEQIELAVAQAVGRGLVAPEQLELDARERGGRVGRLVAGTLRRLAS